MQRMIFFFINPISGARSKVNLENKIRSKCQQHNTPFEILFTKKNGDYHFLPEKIKSVNATDVVICGGDGSVSPIVSAILGIKVNVGLIPLGSGNGLARTAGIPYNIDKALDILFSGKPTVVDAFYINNKLGCQIAGLGYDAFIAAEFAKERKRGLSTYTKLAVKNFLKAGAYNFIIESDAGKIETKAFMVCVTNANQFGNNLKIAPKASMSDGLLDVVILKRTAKLKILISFVNHLLFARKISRIPEKAKKDLLYFNSRKVVIQNPDHAPVHIDGDPGPVSDRFEITILPKAFSLIHPA